MTTRSPRPPARHRGESATGQAPAGACGAEFGACTTTEEELVLGALVLREAMAAGRAPKPVDGDKRLVVPGSVEIVENLRTKGLLDVYERAGFRVGPP